jgi:hypothetical protein
MSLYRSGLVDEENDKTLNFVGNRTGGGGGM